MPFAIWMFDKLDTPGTILLSLVFLGLLSGVIISVVAIVTEAIKSVGTFRGEVGLKHEMIRRGMSAEEIALVVGATRDRRDNASGSGPGLPFACEATARYEGEWCSALVLRAEDGRYFVHYVGTEADSNAWVEGDDIRFPAGSPLPGLAAEAGYGAPWKGPREVEV